MTNLKRNGKKVLESERASSFSKKTSLYVVRIGYRSEGGEALCCDSEPMTLSAAESLRLSLGKHYLEIYKLSSSSDIRSPFVRPGFRLVRFPRPSDPIEYSEEVSS